ncbi:lipid A deacylase LpxR family protein [Marinomonas epiphytica]
MKKILLVWLSLWVGPVVAEMNWASLTFDNDAFVGKDSGYTNGLFLSTYRVSETGESNLTPSIWVSPLLWTLPKGEARRTGSVNSVGQIMMTPEDIQIARPDPDGIPYSALLSYSNLFIKETAKYADRVRTTVGLIGPYAFGEESQSFIHGLIGAAEPQGWDYQLDTELVFEFSRGRIWRSWASKNDTADILLGLDANLGTLRSSVGSGVMLRYGEKLDSSYSSALLTDSRISNPVAIQGGWYVYTGLQVEYVLNDIFLDGNTFESGPSTQYDRSTGTLTAGVAYSWGDLALTFALNAPLSVASSNSEEVEQMNKYGTITLSWPRQR